MPDELLIFKEREELLKLLEDEIHIMNNIFSGFPTQHRFIKKPKNKGYADNSRNKDNPIKVRSMSSLEQKTIDSDQHPDTLQGTFSTPMASKISDQSLAIKALESPEAEDDVGFVKLNHKKGTASSLKAHSGIGKSVDDDGVTAKVTVTVMDEMGRREWILLSGNSSDPIGGGHDLCRYPHHPDARGESLCIAFKPPCWREEDAMAQGFRHTAMNMGARTRDRAKNSDHRHMSFVDFMRSVPLFQMLTLQ
eukprot:gene7688-15737_t